MRSAGAGLATLRIAVDGLPNLFAGLGIESDEGRVSLVQEELAVGILQATVDRVAAHDGDHGRILLGLVLPDDLVLVIEVEGVHDVRERSVEIHRAADDERRTLVAAQNASRERPSNLQAADVLRVDLVEFRITGRSVVTLLHAPVIRVSDTLNNAIIGQRRCREGSRRNQSTCEYAFAHCASSILRFLPRLQAVVNSSASHPNFAGLGFSPSCSLAIDRALLAESQLALMPCHTAAHLRTFFSRLQDDPVTKIHASVNRTRSLT